MYFRRYPFFGASRASVAPESTFIQSTSWRWRKIAPPRENLFALRLLFSTQISEQ
jgi:hypothetical protein